MVTIKECEDLENKISNEISCKYAIDYFYDMDSLRFESKNEDFCITRQSINRIDITNKELIISLAFGARLSFKIKRKGELK